MTDRELMQQALDALEYVIQSVGGNAPESFDVWFQKTQVPAEALRAALAQPEHKPADVFLFLLGEGELDGAKFGERHPTERGNYWWRKHLRAALAQQDHLAGKRKMVAQPEPEELGEIVPANEEQLKRIAKLVEPDDGYCQACDGDSCTAKEGCVARDNPPPQREWKGLTDEELLDIADMAYANDLELLQTLQAKLKEKNHG